MELTQMADSVDSKARLAAFVHALAQDLHARPQEWENTTLEMYLDALAGWLEVSDLEVSDHEGADKAQARAHSPRWQDMAHMLIAAKTYE